MEDQQAGCSVAESTYRVQTPKQLAACTIIAWLADLGQFLIFL